MTCSPRNSWGVVVVAAVGTLYLATPRRVARDTCESLTLGIPVETVTPRLSGLASLVFGLRNASIADLLATMIFIDRLPFLARRRARETALDAEAIRLLELHAQDPEGAYAEARGLARLARSRGDLAMASMQAKVAVRVARLMGRRIGEKRWDEDRYGEPTHVAHEGKIVRLRSSRRRTV